MTTARVVECGRTTARRSTAAAGRAMSMGCHFTKGFANDTDRREAWHWAACINCGDESVCVSRHAVNEHEKSMRHLVHLQ